VEAVQNIMLLQEDQVELVVDTLVLRKLVLMVILPLQVHLKETTVETVMVVVAEVEEVVHQPLVEILQIIILKQEMVQQDLVVILQVLV
jgi:hypothetical protein